VLCFDFFLSAAELYLLVFLVQGLDEVL